MELGGIWAAIVEVVLNQLLGALLNWLLVDVFGIESAE